MIGEDLSGLPLFEGVEGELVDNETVYDSEDDQIIQYADSNVPLNYKEMPTSVCESKKYSLFKMTDWIFKKSIILVLDAACEDNKGILYSVYDSQISRAISIILLPWTLPLEFTFNFTRK